MINIFLLTFLFSVQNFVTISDSCIALGVCNVILPCGPSTVIVDGRVATQEDISDKAIDAMIRKIPASFLTK